MKQYNGLLIGFGSAVALGAGAIALFSHQYKIALGVLIAGLVLLGVACLILRGISKKQQAKMDRVFRENDTAVGTMAQTISIPSAIVDLSGRITWRNNAFLSLYDGQNLKEILPDFDGAHPARTLQVEYNGNHYQVMHMPVHRENAKRLVLSYWLDRTEAAHYQRLYTEQRPYVALILVDNYEELLSDTQIHSTAVLAEVERLIADLSKRLGGLYRRYDNGRFLLILEAKQMQQLEQEKFTLLEQAHRIETGSSAAVSLSFGFGIAPRLAQSEQDARRALELALGRGGDQVVVKDGTDYRFYGGKRQHDPHQSRVKARLFSKALYQLFENSGDVFVMGHRNSDMDCIGAALGVVTCANHVGAHAYIVLDAVNTTIEDAIRTLERSGAASIIITPEHAAEMMKDDSVLVVVDTQRASNTVAPELLGRTEHIVLIDHHRRSADYIDNATLHYLETRASSASEMVTEVIQYFADNVKPAAFTCSALLAGITVDTKQFAFNVGSRTFDAAGYLRRNGADLSSVKQMFQNDYASYVRCANVVEAARIRKSGIAISIVGKNTPDAQLLAAQAADELLGIRGIYAAFVLADLDDMIAISGRSYGQINVQVILERLGGGGHLTMAGAQLRGVDMQQAIAQLDAVLDWYEQENPEK
ncbi:MAG: DHH family phosphoesterase [Clostridia bacterium]|nr:DHH family phosphoesterase [Clostridia bacterium]